MADQRRIKEVVHKDYDERIYHRRPTGVSATKLGIGVAIILLALSWLAFTKSLPFGGSPYEVKAVFESSSTIRETSPVRIAGVNVGEVTGVARKGDASEVTFSVDDSGLPLHADAVATIRPRLFLEGNLFVDLRPGSPSAEEIPDGGTIPMSQTALAVQFDEILTSLQGNDRQNLSRLLRSYGGALMDEPRAEDDADQDPDTRGETAAESINDSFVWGGPAGRDTAIVSQALRGTEPRDLQRLIRGGARTFSALASEEQALRDLITNFNITTGALADESTNLSATIRELAPTLEQTRPSLVRLNETFPPLRQFAQEMRPAVNELPGLIAAGDPWLRQGDRLLSEPELGGLARVIKRSTPGLSRATRAAIPLLEQIDLVSRCTSQVLVPTGDQVINDQFSTGTPNYLELLYGAVAQAGESQNFDGNGSYLRVQPSGGGVQVTAPNPGGGFRDTQLYANTIAPVLGTQPTQPSRRPPLRSDVACHENDVPNLNGPAAAVGPPSPRAVGP
jgi:phospholipid/cholesterol/gamma-HCH transport system substrate-binding protein